MNRPISTAIPSRSIVVLVILVILATAVLGGLRTFMQGWKAVPVDKVALYYTGGPIQGEPLRGGRRPGNGYPLLPAVRARVTQELLILPTGGSQQTSLHS